MILLLIPYENIFDSKLYDEQNSYLNFLIDVKPKDKRNWITDICNVSGLRKVKILQDCLPIDIWHREEESKSVVKENTTLFYWHQKGSRALTRNTKKPSLSLKAEVL